MVMMLAGSFCLCGIGNAMTVNEKGTMIFTGKLEVRNSWRLEDTEDYTYPQMDAGQLSEQRNMLKLEWDHNLDDVTRDLGFGLKYHLLGRAYYDSIFDSGPHEWQDARDANKDDIDDYKSEIEMREAYVDLTKGDYFLRLGKQNIVWGETDMFRLLDQINPLDNYHGLIEDLDEKRVPLWMARMTIGTGNIGPISSPNLDAFIAPCWEDEDDYLGPGAPAGTSFATPSAPSDPLPEFITYSTGEEHPDNGLKDARWGVKVGGIFGDNLTLSLAHFKTYNGYQPRMTSSNFIEVAEGVYAPTNMKLDMVAEDFQVTGGSFNYYDGATDTVYRGEVAYSWDEPVCIESINFGSDPSLAGAGEVAKKDIARFMVGFDKYVWLRALNSNKPFLFSMQYFGQSVQDYEDGMITPVTDVDTDEYEDIKRYESTITLLTNTELYHGRIKPGMFVAYQPQGNWMFQPELAFVKGIFEFKLKASIVEGNSLDSYAMFRDRDQISFTVRCFMN